MDEVRSRLGLLCDGLSQWNSLDGIIRAGGAGPELDELLTGFDHADVDPARSAQLLDAIDAACKRAGLDWPPRAFQPLPHGFTVSPDGDSWVCPHGRCDRVVLPEEAGGPPLCGAGSRIPMKSFRLP